MYSPYGQLISSTLTLTPTDRFFTNQRLESSIGLYDYRARFYDPWVGGFIQPDSIVPDPFEPAAWNRLGYVYGIRFGTPIRVETVSSSGRVKYEWAKLLMGRAGRVLIPKPMALNLLITLLRWRIRPASVMIQPESRRWSV